MNINLSTGVDKKLFHPSANAQNRRQNSEKEIPQNQPGQQAALTQAVGGATIDDNLGDVA